VPRPCSISALTFRTRLKEAFYYPNSAWCVCAVGGRYEFLSQPGVRNLDARTFMFFYATGITPATFNKFVGIGSQYALAFLDADNKPLDGSKTYKLTLPPSIPAKNFWSIVDYDNRTRSELQTDQQFPSIGSEKKGIVLSFKPISNFRASVARRRVSSSIPTPQSMYISGRPRRRTTRGTGFKPYRAKGGIRFCASMVPFNLNMTKRGGRVKSNG
jgi:Protein of unknown function (DUF1214)